jgi:hypothetical protein
VKLYVCYGTFGGDHHACARANGALEAAGRRMIRDLTGSYKVPTLVLDDGTVVDESQAIVDWAAENPVTYVQ